MKDSEELFFSAEMSRCAVATRCDLNESDFAVYWDRFRSWEFADFQVAIRKCCDELSRFPSVSQIRDAYPKRQATVQDLEPYVPLISVDESEEERGTPSLEEFIDEITDETLGELFGSMFANSKNCKTPSQKQSAIEFSIKRFRKNPHGRMYRSVVRDMIWEKRAIYLPSQEERPF